MVVMDSDPATAITMSTSGVRDRHSEGHGHGDDRREDGHPDRSAEVGEPRGDLVGERGPEADRRVERRPVQPGDPVALLHRVVDLGADAGHRGGEDAADDRDDDQQGVGRDPPGAGEGEGASRRTEPAGPGGEVAVPDAFLGRGVVEEAHATIVGVDGLGLNQSAAAAVVSGVPLHPQPAPPDGDHVRHSPRPAGARSRRPRRRGRAAADGGRDRGVALMPTLRLWFAWPIVVARRRRGGPDLRGPRERRELQRRLGGRSPRSTPPSGGT